MLSADGTCDGLSADISFTQPQSKHLGHGGRHECRIGQRRQLDKPHAIIELTENAARDFQSESGLPDAAGPRQGYGAMRLYTIPYLPHGYRSADQARDCYRQITPGGFLGQPYFLQTDRRSRRAMMPDGPLPEQAGLDLRSFLIGPGRFAIGHRVNLKLIVRHDRARSNGYINCPWQWASRARTLMTSNGCPSTVREIQEPRIHARRGRSYTSPTRKSDERHVRLFQ